MAQQNPDVHYSVSPCLLLFPFWNRAKVIRAKLQRIVVGRDQTILLLLADKKPLSISWRLTAFV